MEETSQDILQDEEIEVTADMTTFDLECSLQQLNVDFDLLCGLYLYVDNKTKKINITKIGYPKHIEYLEQEYYKHLKELECQKEE